MTDTDAFAPTVSFMTANFVAREAGWSIPDWSAGDRTTNEAFAPIETFRERFAGLVDEAVGLGFDAMDLWEGHLNASWATPEHVSAAIAVLHERGVRVASAAAPPPRDRLAAARRREAEVPGEQRVVDGRLHR